MLVLSSVAYSIGASFLAMSTPPVLSKAVGTCGAYEPKCVGDTQKVLFYSALPLIAIGISGHMTSLTSFLKQKGKTVFESGWQFVGGVAVILLPTIGIALPYIKPWSVRFGIPAIFTVVATILFLSGSCSYERKLPEGSPLTTVFRVIVASACNIFRHTSHFSCLDKAAIAPTDNRSEKQNRWKVCSAREVKGN